LGKLNSRYSDKEIKKIIKSRFLYSPNLIGGVYHVNSEQVWKFFVEKDPVCKKIASEKKLNDHICVEVVAKEGATLNYKIKADDYPFIIIDKE